MLAYAPLLPFVTLTLVAIAAMLLSALVQQGAKVGWFAASGLAVVGLMSVTQWAAADAPARVLNGAVTVDGFSYFFYVLFCVIGLVTVASAIPYLDRDSGQRGEFYTMMLFSIVGMFVMVSTDDLMTLFVGFETMSLAVYVMVGWRRHLLKSNEAVLKYFFLGSFAAAIFLYGIAMVYGAAGTVNMASMGVGSSLASSPLFVMGALLILVAIAFKVAAFPFHQWTPDIYEGAPAPVTGFMATAIKAAAFALAMRVVLGLFSFGQLHDIALAVLWHLALITMFVGNVFALAQTNVKRMLAYSGIAHTGYLLVGLAALPDADAGAAILFYLFAYAVTNLGALACISFLSGRDERYENIADLAGAAWRYPFVGLGMAICMFSLIGFPPTAGFFGKYYLLLAAMKANLLPLVVVAIINSILSAYYYLRVVVTMYMAPAEDEAHDVGPLPVPTRAAIAYTAVAVLWVGMGTVNATVFLPGAAPLLASAQASFKSLSTISEEPKAPEESKTTTVTPGAHGEQ